MKVWTVGCWDASTIQSKYVGYHLDEMRDDRRILVWYWIISEPTLILISDFLSLESKFNM
jgi:hypothetical protein